MRLNYKFHFQPVGHTYVGVAIGEDSRKFSGMIQLNEVGYDIVSKMKDDITYDQLLEQLLLEYDTDKETLSKYLTEIIEYLTSEGVL